MPEPRIAECDVCRIALGKTDKKEVRYCPRCKAWLCEECKKDWPNRVKAAFLRGMGFKS